jgi:Ubiquitin family
MSTGRNLVLCSPGTATIVLYPSRDLDVAHRQAGCSKIPPNTTGFVNVGVGHVYDILDVPGTWKLLYQQDGKEGNGEVEDPHKSIGPGMNDPTLSEYYIEHNSTIYLEGMKINIALPDGSTISFDVKPRDTVSDIKKGVKYATGISVEEHWLMFDGKEIDDNPTLSDYRIKHGSTLQLEPMKISIHTLDGKTIQFDVKPTDTIRFVKQRENEKEGQRLLFNGTELEDGPTLADYGIKHASTLDLEPTKINVQTLDGRIIPVIVKPSDTMGEIKKKIKQQQKFPWKNSGSCGMGRSCTTGLR